MIPSGPGALIGESFRITQRSCCLVMLISQGTEVVVQPTFVMSGRSARVGGGKKVFMNSCTLLSFVAAVPLSIGM